MSYQINLNTLAVLLVFFINCHTTEARWMTKEDASMEVKFYNQDIVVNTDGTYKAIVEIRKKILNEDGRSEAVNYRLRYDGRISNIKLLEAKTFINGTLYQVDKNRIEHRSLASSNPGFSDKKQLLISFPKAEIGAEIYLKYLEEGINIHPINFYSGKFYYGLRDYWQSSKLTIRSELPLHIKVNDPEKFLDVRKNTDGKIDKIEVTLLKPICRDTVGEPDAAIINEKKLPWISISSLNKWEDLAKKLAPDYEKTINQPLPASFTEIVQKASKVTSVTDKINIVTSLLNVQIQYMGDWRSISSRFIPKTLEEISDSGVGDCKDFTVSTAAMLKALGLKVQVAAVMRGLGDLIPYDALPDTWSFNHVFLKVTDLNGLVYWIDPTNPVSMAQGIFGDVADKMVLILDTKEPSYERSAKIDPKYSKTIIFDQLEIIGDKIVHSGHVIFKGNHTLNFIETKLYNSDDVVKNKVFYNIAGKSLSENEKKELILPKIPNRIAEDLKFKFKYTQDDEVIKTNFSSGIKITTLWADRILNSIEDQVGDLVTFLYPCTITRTTIIKNKKIKFLEKLNYHASTSWVDIQRTANYVNGSTEINDVVVFKKQLISNEDLQTQEYKNLTKHLIQQFKNFVIILDDLLE